METEVALASAGDALLIERAAEILRSGGVVAFPTETVYGLGADARCESGVRRIFEAKGRPPERALICHVDGPESAKTLVEEWGADADRLASLFWPGPLTLVLAKRGLVSSLVSGGGTTVAVRAPDHPVAQALIRALGAPIAAPSANRTARISPTAAAHVLADLGGLIPLILDAGPTAIGLESTIVDLTRSPPVILRQGAIPASAIEACLGRKVIAAEPRRDRSEARPIKLFHGRPPAPAKAVLWLAAMPSSPEMYARRLYDALREAEGTAGIEDDAIWVEMPPDTEAWRPIIARLRALGHAIDSG